MDLAQKIKFLRSENGWTQEDLANKSGVSIQSIKRYETNMGGNITTSNLEKIAKVFNVQTSYFLKDNNGSLEVRKSDENLVRKSFVSPENLSISPTNLKNSQIQQLKEDQILICELSSKVGAGESVDINGIEVYDTTKLVPFSQMLFKTRLKNTNNLRCMQVEGYSMVPMLYPDSWVIADVTARFEGDGLYIINFCGNFMVKLLQKSPDGVLHIISINKDYQSYEIDEDSNVEVYIVGKVLRCVI